LGGGGNSKTPPERINKNSRRKGPERKWLCEPLLTRRKAFQRNCGGLGGNVGGQKKKLGGKKKDGRGGGSKVGQPTDPGTVSDWGMVQAREKQREEKVSQVWFRKGHHLKEGGKGKGKKELQVVRGTAIGSRRGAD